MNKCDICGKQLKSSQGLGGHMRFKHRVAGVAQGERSSLVTEQSFPEILTKTLSQWSDSNTAIMDQSLDANYESFSRNVDRLNSIFAKLDLMRSTPETELAFAKAVSLREDEVGMKASLFVAKAVVDLRKKLTASVKYQVGLDERLSRLEKLNN